MATLKRSLLGACWLLGLAAVAYAQMYTPWVIPYYSTCNARRVPHVLCADEVSIYLGASTPVPISQRSIFYQHSAEDSAATTDFLRGSPAEATTAATTAAANGSAGRILAANAGRLQNFGCATSAPAHAGATFVYRTRVSDTDTSQTCTITDATTSCSDTTNTANATEYVGITMSKTDSTVTDGTQVQHCVVELYY